MDRAFMVSFLLILTVIFAFATFFLAYLLSDRSREANTYRTKADQYLAEAAKFMNSAKQNKELAEQYFAEIAYFKNEAEKFKHSMEEYQEIAEHYKKEADKYYADAEGLRARIEALKPYEQVKDTSSWVAETTRQMQNYIEEVKKYASALIEHARQQAQSVMEDKIVA